MMSTFIHNTPDSYLLLYLCLMLLCAILALAIIKINQPAVIGQILLGCGIAILAHYKIGFFPSMLHEPSLAFLAKVGSIFLLFEIGLESDITEIAHSTKHAIIVAATGVIIPFLLGYFVLSGLISQHPSSNFSLFIGALLAVTSTGVSVSVFKAMGIIRQKPAQIVLTASIIDDIAGLILLSVIISIATLGHINTFGILSTILYIIAFFIISIASGIWLLPQIINKFTAKISLTDDMMALTMLAFCFALAYIAQITGLAAIIGAFMAGLLIKQNYFYAYPAVKHKSINTKANHNEYIISLIAPIGKIFIPIFFIYAGMMVDIITALNLETIKLAVLLSVFAIFSKCICGIFLPKNINKWLVGFGMVPRGEIGIVFALSGLQLKIIDNSLFTAILLMVVITSVITPIILNHLNRKNKVL